MYMYNIRNIQFVDTCFFKEKCNYSLIYDIFLDKSDIVISIIKVHLSSLY